MTPTYICAVCLLPYPIAVTTTPRLACADCGCRLFKLTGEGRKARKQSPTPGATP